MPEPTLLYYIKVTFLHTKTMGFKVEAPNDTTAIIEAMRRIQEMNPMPFVDKVEVSDRE